MQLLGCTIVEFRWFLEGVVTAYFRLISCRDSEGHKGVLLSDQEVAELMMTIRATTRVKTKVARC